MPGAFAAAVTLATPAILVIPIARVVRAVEILRCGGIERHRHCVVCADGHYGSDTRARSRTDSAVRQAAV
jgi:hypothetical protein